MSENSMKSPYDSAEFSEYIKWKEKANSKQLSPIDCIGMWTDICGFKKLIDECNWDLTKLTSTDIFSLLNDFYTFAGQPKLVGPPPIPHEKVVILNDGIAKTIDLNRIQILPARVFLFYFRDSLFAHLAMLRTTRRFGIGIRTILAGGQRVQYSPPKVTGNMMLHYDADNISQDGKRLLETNFVYNPAEFQMNTAFAKAFTIDSLGTKMGFVVNGFFIEKSYFEKISPIDGLKISFVGNTISMLLNNVLVFDLNVKATLSVPLGSLNIEVYHIDRFTIYEQFDGEKVTVEIFDIAEQEKEIDLNNQ